MSNNQAIRNNPSDEELMDAARNNIKESDADRLRREEEESLELARALMAEEAVASYRHHFEVIHNNSEHMSEEFRAVLQAAMQEEEREDAEAIEAEAEDSYAGLLALGDRIGDVKEERWRMESFQQIQKLPVLTFDVNAVSTKDADDSEHKCLVCQCDYDHGDEMRRLPCSHCFHKECVDQWLFSKDVCPYCRTSIVK
jgi:hypothetical protein